MRIGKKREYRADPFAVNAHHTAGDGLIAPNRGIKPLLALLHFLEILGKTAHGALIKGIRRGVVDGSVHLIHPGLHAFHPVDDGGTRFHLPAQHHGVSEAHTDKGHPKHGER